MYQKCFGIKKLADVDKVRALLDANAIAYDEDYSLALFENDEALYRLTGNDEILMTKDGVRLDVEQCAKEFANFLRYTYESDYIDNDRILDGLADWLEEKDYVLYGKNDLKSMRLAIAEDEDEKELIATHSSVDDLLEKGYLFYNWETQAFENAFFCEGHINETFRKDWELIHKVAEEENALIATVIDSAPLLITKGTHYVNRYGYIVYKGAPLKEDYYI